MIQYDEAELRPFQSDALQRARKLYADALRGNPVPKFTTAHVVTGGGKSWMATVFAHELQKLGLVRKVVWITPRSSLADQVAKKSAPAYRRSYNDAPFFRQAGQYGYTTTYQAVASDVALHQAELVEPYLVIIDELHHLISTDCRDELSEAQERDRNWTRQVDKLVEGATHVLGMTGSPFRGDLMPIPYVEYVSTDHGLVPRWDINFDLADALASMCVRPINFHEVTGQVSIDPTSTCEGYDGGIEDVPKHLRGAAVQGAVRDEEFRNPIVRECLDHWLDYRRDNPHSRALVVCGDQEQAREIRDWVRSTYAVKTCLAISDEGSDGRRALRDFRDNRVGEVLLTVAMAYEGLDVPDLTHLAHVGAYRSRPWTEQCFGRVIRIDNDPAAPDPELQIGFVWVPRDPRMNEIVTAIRERTEQGLRDRREVPPPPPPPPGEREERAVSATYEGTILGDLVRGYEEDPSQRANRLMAINHRFRSWPHKELIALASALGEMPKAPPKPARPQPPEESINEREDRLRRDIENTARRIDAAHMRRGDSWSFGDTNKALNKKFGKTRAAMSADELEDVLAYASNMWRVLSRGAS